MRCSFSLMTVVLFPLVALGQEGVRLQEDLSPGVQYEVNCRVEITGALSLPPEKDGKTASSLPLTGTSAIDYAERILPPLKGSTGDRAIRLYRRMDFQRKIGDQTQETSLRPEVRRLVLLRQHQFEVPFSPDGPLLWHEIDLVRTDVFTPALNGLLPAAAVKPGDVWLAKEQALQELTDLEKLDSARLTCTFESVTTLAGRRLAKVKLQGVIQGIGEDGPARHALEGHYLFDLESRHLSYVFVKGVHSLLDKEGKAQGKIEGTFVLTRQPVEQVKELSDASLRGLALEPNEENTQLLMDAPDIGVRFLYPRRWRVQSLTDKQIALDEPKGSGLMITLEPLARTPTGADFMNEARSWLAGKKAPVFKLEAPKKVSDHLETFWLEAEVDKQRVWLDYYVARLPLGGATMVARLVGPEQAALRAEVGRIARSLVFTKKQ